MWGQSGWDAVEGRPSFLKGRPQCEGFFEIKRKAITIKPIAILPLTKEKKRNTSSLRRDSPLINGEEREWRPFVGAGKEAHLFPPGKGKAQLQRSRLPRGLPPHLPRL